MTAPHPAWIGIRIALAVGCCGCTGTDDRECGAASELAPDPSTQASAADLRAILAESCALGGCHASAPGAGGFVLMVNAPTWVEDIVGVPSHENPSMDLVAPGAPEESWIVRKITGDLCGLSCDPQLGCGARMPFGEALTATDRSTIVAWIGDGAPPD